MTRHEYRIDGTCGSRGEKTPKGSETKTRSRREELGEVFEKEVGKRRVQREEGRGRERREESEGLDLYFNVYDRT